MSLSAPYPLQLDFHADPHITRWRPLVQWLLAVPQLMIAYVLRAFRQVLTLISFFTVLFTEQVPRPLFDAIVMTYRFEWRAMSYALFMHEDYPPFDFALSSEDTASSRTRRSALATPSTSSAGSLCTNGYWPSPSTSCWPAYSSWRPSASSLASSLCSSPGSTQRASGASWSTPTGTRSGWRPT